MKKWEATIVAVLSTPDLDDFRTVRRDELTLDFAGIPGDRHYGMTTFSGVRQPMYPRGTEIRNRRQLTILSVEELALIAQDLGVEEVQPEWLGANILISGVPEFTRLPLASRILFENGVGLLCEGENLPCVTSGANVQEAYPEKDKLAVRYVSASNRRRGIVASVERPGVIRAGDKVTVLVNDPENPLQ